MAPVIKIFEKQKHIFQTCVCVTSQHKEMLMQVLDLFEIDPQYDLNIMTHNQKLSELTERILHGLTEVVEKEEPDLVFVQGDTTSTFVAALVSFYAKIPVAHIEAGLRTRDKYSPFPEEINRRIASVLTNFHFAPTEEARSNLIADSIPESSIYVVGNTVIDALKWVVQKHTDEAVREKWNSYFSDEYNISFQPDQRTILVTGHRRESFGEGFANICEGLANLARRNADIQVIYPVHLNPNVQGPVYSILGKIENIHLIPPLEYEPFVFLMNTCHLILTDSGGIQEEAPFLGKPVLVMRNTTERPEGIAAGTAKLVGTDSKKIVEAAEKLLTDETEYKLMAKAISPYGKGDSAEKVFDCVLAVFEEQEERTEIQRKC